VGQIDIDYSELTRIVVAIDPAVTATEDSDDTGIIVVARGPHQDGSRCTIPHCPGHGYVLEDASCHLPPAGWAKTAIAAYDKWRADRIVAETNNGGDLVGTVIHAIRAGVPYAKVTATRGKQMRAEPIAALYEQDRIHELGNFPELKMQQESWTPDSNESPDRLDALVWGLTFLGLIGGQGAAFITAWKDETANRKPAPPAELKSLPHHVNLIDHPVAQERCKNGGRHRFQNEANGARCMVCGGWQE
jgi:phage terminase large subunit-like protein